MPKRQVIAVVLVVGCLAGTAILAPVASAAPKCLGKRATIVKGGARDRITGTKAPDVIVAGGGNDRISGVGGNDRICGGPGNDRIDGGRGVDRLSGGGGNDKLTGFKAPDKLSGDAGNDFLNGQKGSDKLKGGGGEDRLLGDKGNDRLAGGAGRDKLDGGLGDEKSIDGGGGSDLVVGGTGTDDLDGGAGNEDIVRGDSGNDRMSGGPGTLDIAAFSSASRGGVSADLAAGSASGDGHDRLSGFEDLVGSPQSDTLNGDAGSNRIDGGVGDDFLDGRAGRDQAFGGSGTDTCRDFDALSSCGQERRASGQGSFVVLNAGLDGASLIVQGDGRSNALGVARQGGAWVVNDNAPITPGDGCNQTANPAVVSCPGAGGLKLVILTGGNGDDVLAVGSGVARGVQIRANGQAGSDTLKGGPGADVLEAGENYRSADHGRDTLVGRGGGDALYADPGGDRLKGGAGNDLLVSSAAACQGHIFDGQAGSDNVSFARTSAGRMRMRLGGTGGPVGCGNLDRILASNDALEGSPGPDTLIGDGGPNTFYGQGGADRFKGKGGQDFIDAVDGGRDKVLDCGPGAKEGASVDRADPRPRSC